MPNTTDEYESLLSDYEALLEDYGDLKLEVEQLKTQLEEQDERINQALALADRQEYTFGEWIYDLKTTLEG